MRPGPRSVQPVTVEVAGEQTAGEELGAPAGPGHVIAWEQPLQIGGPLGGGAGWSPGAPRGQGGRGELLLASREGCGLAGYRMGCRGLMGEQLLRAPARENEVKG